MSILLLIMVVVFFGTTVSHPFCHTSSGHQSDGFWARDGQQGEGTWKPWDFPWEKGNFLPTKIKILWEL